MAQGPLGRSVSIVSAAYSPLGDVTKTPEILNFSERELFAMTAIEAMQKGGVRAKDIDALYLGCSGPAAQAKIKSAAPFFTDWVGMRGKPAYFHDEGCGSAAAGLQMAAQAIASGQCDCVLTGGVNINFSSAKAGFPPHMRRRQDADETRESMLTGCDAAYELEGDGGNVPPLEGVMVSYMLKHGLTNKDLDECFVNYLVKKREEAILNPKAVNATMTYAEEAKKFRCDTVEKYLFSNKYNPPMGSIIRARFLGQLCDGASSVILMETELAKKYVKNPIEISGIATVTALDKTFCTVPLKADEDLFSEIYRQAGITDPYREVEYMGIHDCPATMILPVAEDAGYFKPGEAFRYMIEGRLNHDSNKPINTTGGRTQSGHPRAGAFNIELAEAVDQMRGAAGVRQMNFMPKTAVVWGGGSGFTNAACVLRKVGE